MLGGRDALEGGGDVHPLVLAIQRGPLGEDAAGLNRMVKRRQCMHIDVGGFLTPIQRCLRPQLLVKIVLAQINTFAKMR